MYWVFDRDEITQNAVEFSMDIEDSFIGRFTHKSEADKLASRMDAIVAAIEVPDGSGSNVVVRGGGIAAGGNIVIGGGMVGGVIGSGSVVAGRNIIGSVRNHSSGAVTEPVVDGYYVFGNVTHTTELEAAYIMKLAKKSQAQRAALKMDGFLVWFEDEKLCAEKPVKE